MCVPSPNVPPPPVPGQQPQQQRQSNNSGTLSHVGGDTSSIYVLKKTTGYTLASGTSSLTAMQTGASPRAMRAARPPPALTQPDSVRSRWRRSCCENPSCVEWHTMVKHTHTLTHANVLGPTRTPSLIIGQQHHHHHPSCMCVYQPHPPLLETYS